jgi:membrane associated rhomboid family serine protease
MQYSSGPLSGLPTVVKNLLIINGIFFLVLMSGLGDWGGRSMTHWLGMHYFASPLFQPWQIVTHMFMHGGLGHLALNMIGLFMLGPPLEYKWGSKRFLTFYMITGIGAGLLYSGAHSFAYFRLLDMLDPDQIELVRREGHGLIMSQRNYIDPLLGEFNAVLNRPMVGASGALYGILLAFGMTYPNVQLMIFPLFIPIKAKYFVLILGGLAVFQALAANPEDNVAHLAHLGGMAVGYVLIKLWQKRDVNRHWQ